MPNRPTADRSETVPQRSERFAHLSLEGLRSYRAALTAEESRVSYWRRIIQARLDLVRSAQYGVVPTVDSLNGMLTEPRLGLGRQVLLSVLPSDDMSPLPNLAELWLREPTAGGRDGAGDCRDGENASLARDLQQAETQLSAYRADLHRRLGGATNELIARYREQPSLCLSALPNVAPLTRAAQATSRTVPVG